MILFPAVDILDGNCVRLLHGKFDDVTVYGSPLEMALKWQEQGAQYLHVVDLNGALKGKQGNLNVISQMVANLNIPVQMGGGIRTLEDIKIRLESTGVSRVILGTACCENPEIVAKAIELYGNEKIVCGIDVADGKVSIKGWTTKSDLTPEQLGKTMKDMGLKYVVFTDISRDGALKGVNADACRDFNKVTGLNVIASGGVSSLDDLSKLESYNMYGAILGKAIYAGKFSVADARRLIK